MKKPNFTHMIFSVLGLGKAKTIWAFSILLTISLISVNQANAQVDCNSILGCGNQVNISMDDDCDILIDPDMILRDQVYANEFYDVEAKFNGSPIQSIQAGTFQGKPVKRPKITRALVGKTIEVKVILRGCSNSCWGSALIEDKLAPEPTSCPCVERIDNFTGTIKGNGPIYARPISSFCNNDPGTFQENSDFIVFKFAISENGQVDINMGNTPAGLPNPTFTLYQGNFNGNLPCTNKITNNTPGTSLSLLNGTNYFLVVAVRDGIFDIPVNVAIEHRTGHILPNAQASVCSMKCSGEAALLAQTVANATSKPVFADNCTTVTLTKSDVTESLGCESRFSKIIKRSWIATDAYGNKSEPKIQLFYIERIKLSEVNCPANIDEKCSNYPKLATGAPDPRFTGVPSNLSCQNIQVYYEDIVFPLCGNGVKVVRQWNIIDWCSGDDKICTQSIKYADEQGPAVTCPADITTQSGPNPRPAAVIDVNASGCSANWPIIPPIAVFDCSKVTWEVAFKKADANGNPPAGAAFVTSEGNTKVSGVKPGFATDISQTARPYTLVGLPLGRTWLRYTVTDECGNSTNCFTEIDVVDRTSPTAICDGTTAVSIDDNGFAEVFAESIDDHSTDNCGVVKFEIKRNTPACPGYPTNTSFGPSIKVCCKDYTGYTGTLSVTLRVYDAAGNFNDCETTINVQLKRAPAVRCPDPKSINCSDPKLLAWASGTQAFDTVFFGRPTLTGICVTNGLFSSRIKADNRNVKCGTGTIVREWKLISNPSLTCDQIITVTAPSFSSSNVVFPSEVRLPSCDLNAATPEALNSKPIIGSTACRDLGVSFTDQLFYDAPEACVKIVRTWKVIDWCTYQSSGLVVEGIQKILLIGTTGPSFADCRNITVDTDNSTCDKEVTLSATATDACTDQEDMRYTWKLDINKDGTFNANGIGNRFTRTLAVGTHSVTFTAENRCGVTKECKYDIIVRSNKKPTPICLREVVWVLDPFGTTEVWAADFNLKSEGSCGSTGNLKYSFDAAGTQRAKTFTCADIPNGQVARIPLKMYVTDSFGNSEYCEVILILQDSPLNNKCTDVSGLLPKVAGRIATEDEKGLSQVEVKLTNMQSSAELKATTATLGAYQFDGVDVFDPKTIGADNNTNHLNGVSTLDLVMIQRHILGIAKLNSPYKLLAADINNSQSVTASDLVNLRKLILGITIDFENNTSWRFVPQNHVFEDVNNPYDFPSKINIDSLFEDKNNVNFTAVKVGDVNGSVVANAQDNNTSSRTKNALITLTPQSYNAGEDVRIAIRAGSIMEVIGGQMAFDFDAEALTLSNIESGKLLVQTSQYVGKNGKIRMSLDAANGVKIDADDVLFTLVFHSHLSGTTDLNIDLGSIKSEVYNANAEAMELDLQTRSQGETSGKNNLFQNEPNPFSEFTKIAFELQKAGNAQVSILDVNGKVVFKMNDSFHKGYNVVQVHASQLQTSGVYYYQIDAEGFSATRKMIMIK